MRTLDNMELALVRGALDSLGTTLADKGHNWTEGERAIYEQAIELLKPDPRDELLERRRVGAMLANCAFNLRQREEITENDRAALSKCQGQWDAIKSC